MPAESVSVGEAGSFEKKSVVVIGSVLEATSVVPGGLLGCTVVTTVCTGAGTVVLGVVLPKTMAFTVTVSLIAEATVVPIYCTCSEMRQLATPLRPIAQDW